MPWSWPFGKKKQAPVKSHEEGFFSSGVRDDYLVSSVRELTPAKLGSAMRAAEEGDTCSQYEVFEFVEQDPHVLSASDRRRRACIQNKLQLSPPTEDAKAKLAVDVCNNIIFGENGRGGIENWSEALFDLSDAIGKAFALGQIVWEQDGGKWTVKRIERWPQRECVLGDPLTIVDGNADEINIVTEADRISGEPLVPYQWITHRQKAWSVPLSRAALYRAITWYYLFKRFSIKDWAIFTEKYGVPLRQGTYPAGATTREKEELWKAVLSLGKDSACIFPDGATIGLIESKMGQGGGSLPHPLLADFCNKEISKALLGSTMAVDPGDKGARSQGEVYERAEGNQTVKDCQNLAETIRRDLLTPIVGFNLGWDVPVPLVEFVFEEKQDLLLLAQRDKILIDAGLPIAKRYFYETYSKDMEPVGGEETVDKPVAPSPFGVGKGSTGNIDENNPDQNVNDNTDENQDEQATAASALSEVTMADIIAIAASKKKSREWAASMNSLRAAPSKPFPHKKS